MEQAMAIPSPTVPWSTPPTGRLPRLGLFERFRRGWALTKASFRVLRQDKELVVLPLLSLLATGAMWVVFFASLFITSGFPAGPSFPGTWFSGPWFYLALFALYLATSFVALFFTAAVMGEAQIRLDGGNPTLADGLRFAAQNVGRIAAWAAITATVGLLLRALSERAGIVGRIIAGAIGFVWAIATFFVLPVILFERLASVAAIRRSAGLIRSTWGESLAGEVGLGLVFGLLALAGLIPLFLGIYILIVAANFLVFIALVAVAFAYWIILGLFASAAQAILVVALYRYATTGRIGFGFPPEVMARPFVR